MIGGSFFALLRAAKKNSFFGKIFLDFCLYFGIIPPMFAPVLSDRRESKGEDKR